MARCLIDTDMMIDVSCRQRAEKGAFSAATAAGAAARRRAGSVSLNCEALAMTIAAKYEDGVFRPLEDVKLTEGTGVEVHVPEEAAPKRPKAVRDSPIFGMWAGGEDIPDGVAYEDRIRRPRY